MDDYYTVYIFYHFCHFGLASNLAALRLLSKKIKRRRDDKNQLKLDMFRKKQLELQMLATVKDTKIGSKEPLSFFSREPIDPRVSSTPHILPPKPGLYPRLLDSTSHGSPSPTQLISSIEPDMMKNKITRDFQLLPASTARTPSQKTKDEKIPIQKDYPQKNGKIKPERYHHQIRVNNVHEWISRIGCSTSPIPYFSPNKRVLLIPEISTEDLADKNDEKNEENNDPLDAVENDTSKKLANPLPYLNAVLETDVEIPNETKNGNVPISTFSLPTSVSFNTSPHGTENMAQKSKEKILWNLPDKRAEARLNRILENPWMYTTNLRFYSMPTVVDSGISSTNATQNLSANHIADNLRNIIPHPANGIPGKNSQPIIFGYHQISHETATSFNILSQDYSNFGEEGNLKKNLEGMSATGSFEAIVGERRRVAHRPNESVKDVIRGLAFKKQSVAQMVNLLASRSGKKNNRTQFQHASKGEEEELIGNRSNGEEFKNLETLHTITGWNRRDSNAEIVENEKEISKVPSRSVRVAPNIVHKDLTFEERLQTFTDSESSDQKSDTKQPVKWLCKPRLGSLLKQDDVHIVTQSTARKGGRKRAVISSSSDEKSEKDEEKINELDDGHDELVDNNSTNVPVSLKMVVKKVKKRRKYVNSSSEENESGEHYDSDSSARIEKSDSSGESGQVMERRSRNAFRNTPSSESRLLQCPRGSCAAEQYLDFWKTEMQASFVSANRSELAYDDAQGLGKTVQIIAFITYLKSEQIKGPHLIVVPSSTIENWLSEFSKWSPKINIITYYGSIADRRQLRYMATDKNIDVLLTTYNMVGSKTEDRKFFKRFRINYVIYDEGHLLKNCSTDRYKNLMKIHGERKILITGTPLQNNLVELISLMYFTMTKLFTKYCNDIGQLLQQFQQKIPALEAKNGALYEADKIEQAKAILKPYILRRLKADVSAKLFASEKECVIKCPMIMEQKEIYTDLVREFRLIESSGEKYNSSPLMQLRQVANHPLLYRRLYDDDKVTQIAKVLCAKENEYRKKKSDHVAEDLAFLSDFAISQLCSKFISTQSFILNEKVTLESGKFKELDKLLPSIKEKGDKVLIFSQFTSIMDILEVYLKLRDYQYCRLDAGGLGINLTAANHIILHDIDFNPYNDKQAEGRCHRMGQTKDVFVVRLISADTVEEEMLALAQKKLELEKEVTGASTAENGEMENLIIEKLLKNALAL
ncbi:SWI/SNF-related matrix-associated actin-dependent regulator of chromatin subfamily A [Dirofilaria immitis]|nr:SWI/SNF-related matrix-associated actin-dependent regulator of chromatin subfamily A [Dirofilaria immitis]